MLEWESTYHCFLLGEQGAEPYMLNSIRQNAPTLESEILFLGFKTFCKTITLTLHHTVAVPPPNKR